MTRADQLAADVERALWEYLGDEAAFTPEYPGLARAFAQIVAQASGGASCDSTTAIGLVTDLIESLRQIAAL